MYCENEPLILKRLMQASKQEVDVWKCDLSVKLAPGKVKLMCVHGGIKWSWSLSCEVRLEDQQDLFVKLQIYK